MIIRIFTVRMRKAKVLSYPLSIQRRHEIDLADAQADLNLCLGTQIESGLIRFNCQQGFEWFPDQQTFFKY